MAPVARGCKWSRARLLSLDVQALGVDRSRIYPPAGDRSNGSEPRVLATWEGPLCWVAEAEIPLWWEPAASRRHRSEGRGFESRRRRFLLSKSPLKFTNCICLYTVQCIGVSCKLYMYSNIYMWEMCLSNEQKEPGDGPKKKEKSFWPLIFESITIPFVLYRSVNIQLKRNKPSSQTFKWHLHSKYLFSLLAHLYLSNKSLGLGGT